MKNWVALVGIALLAAGCGKFERMVDQATGPSVTGSGKVVTKSQSVGTFKSVEFDGPFDADLTVGKKSDLKIEGDDNIVPLVKTRIDGDTLRVYIEGKYSTSHTLKVTLSNPILEGASVNGSGDVVVHSVQGSRFSVAINGSGSATVDGSANDISADINGSGDLKLRKLKAKTASAAIHGSGNIEVSASDTLNASIAGSGNIFYSGSPKVTKSVAGSGAIEQR